jgi:hypothetical protein
MSRVLHLFKGEHTREAVAVIAPQAEAGDEVTVALLGGVSPPPLPDGVTVRRVPDDASYERLLELIFAADHVVTW